MKVGEIGSGTSVECRFGCGDCTDWVWDQRVGWVFGQETSIFAFIFAKVCRMPYGKIFTDSTRPW